LSWLVGLFSLEGLRAFHSRHWFGCGLFSRYRDACMTDAGGGSEHTPVSGRPAGDTPEVKSFMQFFHIKTAISASSSSRGDIFVHVTIGAAWRIRAVKDSNHLAKKSFVLRR
jgi:hypothetical protein